VTDHYGVFANLHFWSMPGLDKVIFLSEESARLIVGGKRADPFPPALRVDDPERTIREGE